MDGLAGRAPRLPNLRPIFHLLEFCLTQFSDLLFVVSKLSRGKIYSQTVLISSAYVRSDHNFPHGKSRNGVAEQSKRFYRNEYLGMCGRKYSESLNNVAVRDSRIAENPRTIFYFTVATNENMLFLSSRYALKAQFIIRLIAGLYKRRGGQNLRSNSVRLLFILPILATIFYRVIFKLKKNVKRGRSTIEWKVVGIMQENEAKWRFPNIQLSSDRGAISISR